MRGVGPSLILTTALAAIAGAGTSWTPIGPFGGTVTVLAGFPSDADKVLAGTEHGLYLSEDRGDSWRLVGLAGRAVTAVAVAPSNGDVVYAADRSSGWSGGRIVRSVDGGQTWNERTPIPDLPSGTGSAVGYALAVHPADPQTVLVAADRGVFRTQDGAASWQRLGCGSSRAVVIDPHNPDTYFVAFVPVSTLDSCDGVQSSADGGQSWQPASGGLHRARPNGRSGFAWVDHLVALAGAPSLLLATANEGGALGEDRTQLLRSLDGGQHWESLLDLAPVPSSHGGNRLALAVDPTDARRMVVASYSAGVRRSLDGGASWEDVTGETSFGEVLPEQKPAQELHAAVWLPGASPRVLLGSDREGVWVSDDMGVSWRQSNQGLAALGVNDLLASQEVLLAATSERAVQRTLDGGRSWSTGTGMASPRPPYRGSSPVAVSYCGAAWRLAAGREGAIEVLSCRGYLSHDEGVSWGPGGEERWDVIVLRAPDDPSSMLAIPRWVASEGESRERPLRSRDGGQSWEPCGPLPQTATWGLNVHDAVYDPARAGAIHLATSLGVLTSSDECASWQLANAGLPSPCRNEPHTAAWALASLPLAPDRLVVGTSCGVYSSIDSAATWQLATSAEVEVISFGFDPQARATLLAATTAHGVLRSLDGGASWAPLGEGLPALPVQRVLILSGRSVIAATAGAGVWRLEMASPVRRMIRRASAPPPSPAAVR